MGGRQRCAGVGAQGGGGAAAQPARWRQRRGELSLTRRPMGSHALRLVPAEQGRQCRHARVLRRGSRGAGEVGGPSQPAARRAGRQARRPPTQQRSGPAQAPIPSGGRTSANSSRLLLSCSASAGGTGSTVPGHVSPARTGSGALSKPAPPRACSSHMARSNHRSVKPGPQREAAPRTQLPVCAPALRCLDTPRIRYSNNPAAAPCGQLPVWAAAPPSARTATRRTLLLALWLQLLRRLQQRQLLRRAHVVHRHGQRRRRQ